MAVFGQYAQYYDLLYKEKDYAREARDVADVISQHAPNAKSILELGCGTGGHAVHLAADGYDLHGFDLSDDMLVTANQRKVELAPEVGDKLRFAQGDVRSLRSGETYDVVISLFHVMSYQTSNEDLIAAFKTAAEHLSDDGVFIFDFWYGPCVLTHQPEVRVKRMENDKISVVRLAEPVMHPSRNGVDVNYTVFIRDQASDAVQEVHETHAMRYIFEPELDFLLKEVGLKRRATFEWHSNADPSHDSWDVCCVAGR